MPDADVADRIRENLNGIRERIAAAAARSGRPADAVTLVAVTKYVDAGMVRLLLDAGCLDFGESRPQQLWEKAAALNHAPTAGSPVRWHLIGPLQRNKIARTLPLIHLLHSGESLKLLESAAAEAHRQHLVLPVLLEVNISGEPAKHGFPPHEVEPLLPRLAGLQHLRIQGLMAMAGRDSGVAVAGTQFARLRMLRDRLAAVSPDHLQWTDLSMGMSDDFEAAIEEGATIVRIGSALFEGVR